MIAIILFALSFSLAFYLNKKKIALPELLSSWISNIEAVIPEIYRSLGFDENNNAQTYDIGFTPMESFLPQMVHEQQKLPVELGSYAVACTLNHQKFTPWKFNAPDDVVKFYICDNNANWRTPKRLIR